MAARIKPDYKILKELYSTFDPLKHDHQAPFSPLYRPGQEQRMDRRENNTTDQLRDDHIPSLPLNDDLHSDRGGHQNILEEEDLSPRLTDRIDPRYGSAKGKREPPSSPYGNALQGRESQMSVGSQNNVMRQPLTSREKEEYFRYRANNSIDNGGQAKVTTFNGADAGRGAYTDRTGQRNYQADDMEEKPWTDRRYNSANRMVDPRQGTMRYGDASTSNRLRHGGALLFIRFPTGSGPNNNENVAVASQAFLRSKTHDMGGKFLGLAKKVTDFGYPDGPREALGVYHFPSPEKALLFFQYDMTIRQPDFPSPYGHAEMWIVSNAYLPDNLDAYNTFLLSEIMLHEGVTKRDFFEDFQKPFEGYLSRHGVMPFVVCSYGPNDRQSLRRHAYHHQAIVTCHLFQGQDHLRWMNDEEQYLKYRGFHNQMAEEKCMVFTLDRNLCP